MTFEFEFDQYSWIACWISRRSLLLAFCCIRAEKTCKQLTPIFICHLKTCLSQICRTWCAVCSFICHFQVLPVTGKIDIACCLADNWCHGPGTSTWCFVFSCIFVIWCYYVLGLLLILRVPWLFCLDVLYYISPCVFNPCVSLCVSVSSYALWHGLGDQQGCVSLSGV